jgi:hypothetical protein
MRPEPQKICSTKNDHSHSKKKRKSYLKPNHTSKKRTRLRPGDPPNRLHHGLLSESESNSCQGLPSDAQSTVKLYLQVHKKYCIFASTVDVDDNQQPKLFKLWLVSDQNVNWFLVQRFIDFHVTCQESSPACHITEALVYLQRRLSDVMQESGRIS